jgi:hypothetical protein
VHCVRLDRSMEAADRQSVLLCIEAFSCV